MNRMKLILLAASLLCFVSASFGEPRSRQIADRALPAVTTIRTVDQTGRNVAFGSAFYVSPKKLVTNLHVLEGATKGYAKLADGHNEEMFETALADPYWDLAVITVGTESSNSLALDSTMPKVGDTVYAVGNPEGLEKTFSQGIVSSLRKLDKGELIQMTAPISAGSSGGPVLNETGDVIGIAVASLKAGQNLNFAIPSQYLDQLLKGNGKARNLSAIGSKYPWTSPNTIGTADVTVEDFRLEMNGKPKFGMDFSFRVRNNTARDIKNVSYIIFEIREGRQCDYLEGTIQGPILHELAKTFRGELNPQMANNAWGGKWLNQQGDFTFGREEDNFAVRVLKFEGAE